MKVTISHRRTSPVHLTGSNNILTLTASGEIDSSSAFGIYTDKSTKNNTISVDGSISSETASDEDAGIGVGLASDSSIVKVGEHGRISAEGAGISVTGDNTSVRNAGTIVGTSDFGSGIDARLFEDPLGVSIVNSGKISAASGIVCGYATTITNSGDGRITGQSYGIFAVTGDMTLINHGLIKGNDAAILSTLDRGSTIDNEGSIVGDITLADGDDILDNRGGTIRGTVSMGAGDDIFITDDATISIVENPDGGWDRVKSTVSYTLPENVESLTLLGKKNIDATGNDNADADNFLFGNSGDNVLNGRDGTNVMFGRGGTDTLIGNDGYDLFGISKGCGHDICKGYVDGDDQIIIDDIRVSVSHLKSHVEQHGNDTWIEFGKDALILKGVDHRVIDQSDFTSFG